MADLWSILDSKQPIPVLDTYIHRSLNQPLTFATYHKAKADEQVVLPVDRANALLAHAPRIVDLDLTLKKTDYPTVVHSLSQLSNSAESLVLSLVEDDEAITTDDEEANTPVLPGNIFGGQRPQYLYKLSLRGCRIEWASPLLHRLVTLRLDSQTRPTWPVLYEVLSQQFYLQTLQLDGCLPFPDPAFDHLFPCIPTLTELIISDAYITCLSFLQHIQDQVAYISAACHTMAHGSGHELITRCANLLQENCDDDPISDLEIRTESSASNSLIQLVGRQRNPNSIDATSFSVTFEYDAYAPLQAHIDRLLPVIAGDKIARVRSLECDFHLGMIAGFWLNADYGLMPHLIHLKLKSAVALTTYLEACSFLLMLFQKSGTVLPRRPFPQVQQVFADWAGFPHDPKELEEFVRNANIPWRQLVSDMEVDSDM
ncbi:hypothetical protein ONZ45_g345 [Pleurotus djamor]|nr:hypothetical protein ONZ45_g345 [Pleurotus djamor]